MQQTARYAVPYTVDVLPQSTLEVLPGNRVTLVFNVTNHQPQLAELTFTCRVAAYPIFSQLSIRPPR